MLIQRGIMKYSSDGSDGKSASCRLVYPVRHFPGHIYCGKGCVVAKGESVGISGLPMFNVESSGKCKISKSFGRTQFSVLKNLIFFSVSH